MKIWPAIDLYEGKVVRLTQGNFSARTDYGTDPLAVARAFLSVGCPRLHVVDLEGARVGEPKHEALLPKLASLGLSVRYGGGLRSAGSIDRVLSSGADFAMVGSLLFASPATPTELFERFGEKVIPAVDVKEGKVAIRGWTENLACSPLTALEGLFPAGFRRCLVTSVERDGTGKGPDLALYGMLRRELPETEIMAAGGIASLEDLFALKALGVTDAVVGKALYEGKIDLAGALEVETPCS